MAENLPKEPAEQAPGAASVLGSATYEIIRQRLQSQGNTLRERMAQLDASRQEVFGNIEFKLLQADRITTAHNCVPQDMVQIGHGRFLFGFNIHFGLKKEIELADVFAIYNRDEASGTFKEADLELLGESNFLTDFKRLYNVYAKASFSKFSVIGQSLYMVFHTGTSANDVAVFKWAFQNDSLRYVDGRAESEYRKVGFPSQYEFRWLTPNRESFRYGDHPHISIEDRVFVECVGGDLTIKVEDNTDTGGGIYSEPVDDKNQKVDDAEITYAVLDHLILLKIRPYKETNPRFFIFNEKLQQAVRVDSIGQSCVLLPEDHGLIFPDGYYLGTGELKQFDSKEKGMTIERVIHASNGEDSLYVFYDRQTAEYVLMPYRLIAQKVEERITCHGFSLFPNGHLVSFRSEAEAQKHHMIQLRQTAFCQAGYEPAGKKDSFLYQVGNKDVVRCLSESNEILTLVRKENPYAELYTDLVKRCGAILDAYPWLNTEHGFQINEALKQVREVADKAVDEFDKVRRLQREAVQQVQDVRKRSEERFNALRRASFDKLEDYVHNLSALRHLRGELITLKEVRYVDVAQLEELEKQVTEQTDQLANDCVQFLLKPEALEPYRKQAAEQMAAVEKVTRTAEGKKIEKIVADAGGELELLIEIVNSLKIEDATETTRIIDGITTIYSTLNQIKAALKKHLKSLAAEEGAAQFNAQIKLLSQSAASYLDLCDSPAKCEEYLNRITVQLEELEGTFADFEEYTIQLSERRTELYEAFEQRKVALIEQRNRRANALLTAAERILKVIHNRLAGFKTIEDINTYMASDLMAAKVRETIEQLLAMEDAVKADDLQGRLKSVQQEAVRQLKDRNELFVGGENVIQFGKHRFNINTQPLDLTMVNRDGVQHLHLTSTKYFEEITDEAFLATRAVWNQEVISENHDVYRGEYLAYKLLQSLEAENGSAAVIAVSEDERLALLQNFMGSRYQEGYTKGIHDLDAAKIFHTLLSTHLNLHLARYHPTVRACAIVFWHRFCSTEARALWTAKLKGFGERNKLFPGDPAQQTYIAALQKLIAAFIEETPLYAKEHAEAAGEYLFHELSSGDKFVVSFEADKLVSDFRKHLVTKGCEDAFAKAVESLSDHSSSRLELIRDWARGFLLSREGLGTYLEEVAALLFCGDELNRNVVRSETSATIEGMRGSHSLIDGNSYRFEYLSFQDKLRRFEHDVVPPFERYHQLKQQLVERERRRLRLDEFKPRVLGSFMRSQLLDEVYLPLVGDNLAKQIGAAGATKRTDLMGLLLLISPPGYGKTTLMEYVASRLGIVFVKINGPALGHDVTSLDPEEAPNAAAREEVQKLNLALEMGDNVLICVDDIQHTNPEFLQKFISLCDGQRKIEGVWRGKPRTYDLRGRKVVVVMAGNPYTESGMKFKLPDMLANRADTYNLGDILGGNADSFKSSYIENAVTSNAVLSQLANKSQKDIRGFIRMAELGDRDTAGFEGSYSAQEVEEILSVVKKLVVIRDVVLKVNLAYIHSAAQADEFRTEPPFRLQGSYRNMNRLTEKVVPIMNDAEVRALLLDHYRGESQTLTTGAEANFLKFKEMMDWATPEEKERWEDIKKTFKRNQLTRGVDQSDAVGRVVAQLSSFQAGLESIHGTLEKQLTKKQPQLVVDFAPLQPSIEALRNAVETQAARSNGDGAVSKSEIIVSEQFTEAMNSLREELSRAIAADRASTVAERLSNVLHEMKTMHSTLATLKDVTAQQRNHLRNVEERLGAQAKDGVVEFALTQEMLQNEQAFLERFQQALSQTEQPPEASAEESKPKKKK
ncbi:MAG: DNA repair ATPase [Verrucomicrobia bacterium]|nr:DNA repair ATPase [Verrucomicrobiota bacterium]